ncbi:MAG: hypothetical protein KOO69_04050, partial [Victivallales bacterium]|nr:hypothetical protein [Victivallales bacterium]
MTFYSYNISIIAIMPSFAGLWWGWIVIVAVIFLFAFYFMHPKKQKSMDKKSWNDHFVDPPEYSDSKPGKDKKHDAFHEIMQKNAKTTRQKNYFLWDDGLIFCGFMLQGTDLRTANLYGAYLRDIYLRERNLDGSHKPLIFRNSASYKAIDMSGTYLKNEISLMDGADIGHVDLSGLYLRDVGLQGIDISDILESEESKFGDY